jgi:hypothetical protein
VPSAPDRFSIEYRAESGALTAALPAPVERVAELIPGVFERLGLPVAPASNTRTLTFITPTLKVSGRLYEGESNSDYFDCGRDIRGAQADFLELRFVVLAELRPADDGGTVLETRVDGNARNRYREGSRFPCSGTGKLERQIEALLRHELGG